MKATSSNLVGPTLNKNFNSKLKFFYNKGDNIKPNSFPKLLFSIFFLIILVLAYFITQPFLTAIVTGAIIAYLSYPLYESALKRIKSKTAAAAVISIFIVLLIIVPLVSVLGLVTAEAYNTYATLDSHNLGTNLMKVACKEQNWLSCKVVKSIANFLPENEQIKSFGSTEAKLDYYIQVTIKKITEFIIKNFSQFLVSLPSLILNFFIMIFIVYYLLKDGDYIASRIKNILPFKEIHKQEIIEKFHDLAYGTFYGNILVAVLQGFLAGIGFYFFGVPSPILWGFVTIFFALLPYFGTAIIWLPAALNLILIGYLQNDSASTINGIILLVYGTLVISTIDNVIKPKLISRKSHLHPVLILLGALGGLSFSGFIGLILGPFILALLITFLDIYETEKGDIQKYF